MAARSDSRGHYYIYAPDGRFSRRLPTLDAAHRLGLKGAVGPGVLGVTPAQLLSNLKIGRLPEGTEVGGELHGLVARREEFHEHGTAPLVDTRRVGQAETLLKAHAEYGSIGAGAVVEAQPAARGHDEVGRRRLRS